MKLHDYFHLAINYDLKELYGVMTIRIFVLALVGVYIPIYFIKMGLSLFSISLYYIYVQIILIIFYTIIAKLVKYIAPKYMLVLYAPFLFIHLFFLNSFKDLTFFRMVIIGFFYAISVAFFWMPFKLILSETIADNNSGKQIGVLKLINLLLKLINPFIGALIIMFFGFNSLFIVGMFVLIASLIPILKIRSSRRYVFDFDYVKTHFFRKNSFAFFAEGSTTIAEMLLWPLFVFILLKTYLAVGVLQSIANGVILILTSLVAYFTDHFSKDKLIKAGSFGYSFSWILRQSARLPSFVFAYGIFGYIAQNFLLIPYTAKFYDLFKKHHPLEHLYIRNIFNDIGRLTYLFIFMFLVLLLTKNAAFFLAFVLSAIFSFLYWFF